MGLVGRILGWDEVDRVAAELAEAFVRKLPPTQMKSSVRVERAIGELAAEARSIKLARRWGFVKSTRLGDSVRWALIERGYPQPLGEDVARLIAVAAVYTDDRGKR